MEDLSEMESVIALCLYSFLSASKRKGRTSWRSGYKNLRTIPVSSGFVFNKTFASVFTTLWKYGEHLLSTIRRLVKIPVNSKIDFPFRDSICDDCSDFYWTVKNGIYLIMKRNQNTTLLIVICSFFIARLGPKLHISAITFNLARIYHINKLT